MSSRREKTEKAKAARMAAATYKEAQAQAVHNAALQAGLAARLWDNVRYALSGWGAQVKVHHVPPEHLTQAAAVLAGQMPGASSQPLDSRAWAFPGEVRRWEAPPPPPILDLSPPLGLEAAVSGNLAGEVSIPADFALKPGLGRNCGAAALADWEIASAQSYALAAQIAGRGAVQRLNLPRPQALRVGPLPIPHPALTRRRSDPRVPLAVSSGRLRSGLALLGRQAQTRRSQAPPPGQSVTDGFPVEWRRLAMGAKLLPEEVVVLGVFPGIPVSALQRLVVSPLGETLEFWLKPDTLGHQPLTLRTLVIGRETATGRRLQAIL